MVGTIFGLGLSQQFDENGDPHSGALLYIYEAGTSTPVTVYQNFALSSEHQWPMVADAAGRIPAFWLNDGSYRVRLTTSGGSTIFDETSITAIGDSSAGTTVVSDVSSQVLFQTGDMVATFDEGTRAGWVKMWGTIGPNGSSATNRANDDTEALFAFLWDNVSDTYAPVTGGRGASAAADFSASKDIQIPDMQGRMFIGLDDMAGGNPAADVVAAATEAGKNGGSEDVTIGETNLPSHTHGPGTLTVAAHAHGAGSYAVGAHSHGAGTYATVSHNHSAGSYSADSHVHGTYYRTLAQGGTNRNEVVSSGGATGNISTTASGAVNVSGFSGSSTPGLTGTSAESTPSFSGSSAEASPALDAGVTGATGSGTALASMNPWVAGTWFIKL